MCYTRSALETMDLDAVRLTGYGFQIEMKYSATKLKFKVVEVPIIFTDRTLGESKMNKSIFREAIFGVMALRLRKIKARKVN
jgi:dolichol-phosphate mannosyltransferase